MSVFAGELIGTMLLIIFGGGVVGGVLLKHSKSENAGWITITTGWGLAVTIAIYTVGSVSGAHLNPAVTVALASVGALPWHDVVLYISAQLVGAFLGAVFVWIFYLPHWRQTDDKALKLAVFCTGPAIKQPSSNVVSEMLGTAVLLFGIMSIGANKFSEGLSPLAIGGLIMAIGLSLGGTTGYAINPARDFGPRLAHFLLPVVGKGGSDWRYAWVPVIGPLVGGMLGALLHKAFFAQEIHMLIYVVVPVAVGIIGWAIVDEKPWNN